MGLNIEELKKIHQQYKLGLNVDDEMEQVFEHIESQGRELSKYIEAFKPLNTNAVGVLIDSNKELKAKLQEAENNDYILGLEFKVSNLEAKLEAIESNKVAEFSGEAVQRYQDPSYRFIDNGIDEFMESTTMEAGKRYTVTISKDAKCN